MAPRSLFAPAWFLAGGLLFGCGAQPGVCSVRDEPVLHPDGGAIACMGPEECPLPSNTYLCVTDVSLDRERRPCVACLSSQCARRIPVPCP